MLTSRKNENILKYWLYLVSLDIFFPFLFFLFYGGLFFHFVHLKSDAHCDLPVFCHRSPSINILQHPATPQYLCPPPLMPSIPKPLLKLGCCPFPTLDSTPSRLTELSILLPQTLWNAHHILSIIFYIM